MADPYDYKAQFPDECLDLARKAKGVDAVVKGLKRIRPQTLCSLIDISGNVSADEAFNPLMMEKLMASLERVLTENTNLRTLLTTSNHMFDSSPHPNNQHLHYYLRDLAELLSTSSIVELDVSDNSIIGHDGKMLSGLSALIRKFLVPKVRSLARLEMRLVCSGSLISRHTNPHPEIPRPQGGRLLALPALSLSFALALALALSHSLSLSHHLRAR